MALDSMSTAWDPDWLLSRSPSGREHDRRVDTLEPADPDDRAAFPMHDEQADLEALGMYEEEP